MHNMCTVVWVLGMQGLNKFFGGQWLPLEQELSHLAKHSDSGRSAVELDGP